MGDVQERFDVPEEWRRQVDEVVAHLVGLRGGGAFLSSMDGRVLVRWLERGVPVAVIAVALDQVALRRRKKRTRTWLSLNACRRDVRQLHAEWLARITAGGGVIRAAAQALTWLPDASLEGEALAELDALFANRGEEDAELAENAMVVVRRFQAAAWEAARPEWPALLAEAEVELKDVRNVFDPADWPMAVEEVARDRLRRRHPRLTASAVWDRLHAP